MNEREDTARVLLVAALVMAGAFAAALLAGEGALVLGFLGIFAAATWALDREVRGYLRARFRKAPGASPGASPAAPSSARTSARGWGASRAPGAD